MLTTEESPSITTQQNDTHTKYTHNESLTENHCNKSLTKHKSKKKRKHQDDEENTAMVVIEKKRKIDYNESLLNMTNDPSHNHVKKKKKKHKHHRDLNHNVDDTTHVI